jgi:K+-sensing histidine kinase KdpD
MSRNVEPAWRRYAISLTAVAAAAAMSWILPSDYGVGATALFFAAVTVSSWFGGLGPGLLASALSAVVLDFLVIPPSFEWVGRGEAVLQVAVFAVAAALTSFLNEARRYFEAEQRSRAERIALRWLDERRKKAESLRELAAELGRSAASIADAVGSLPWATGTDPARAALDLRLRRMSELVDTLAASQKLDPGRPSDWPDPSASDRGPSSTPD